MQEVPHQWDQQDCMQCKPCFAGMKTWLIILVNICHVKFVVLQMHVRSGPSLGKCWAKIRLKPPLTLRLLGLWGVMNIINGIARGVSPCVWAPPSLAAEEGEEYLRKWF